MADYFLDSSALVKRMILEQGSDWISELCEPGRHQIHIADVALAEVAAALASKARNHDGIGVADRDRILSIFLSDCDQQYQVIGVTRPVIDLAVGLTQRNRLRGYDAIQLANALLLNHSRVSAGLASLRFVTADRDLIAAATQEGLASDNPNDH